MFVYTCVGVGHFDFLCAHFLSHSRLPSRASPFPGVRPPRPAPHTENFSPRPPRRAPARARPTARETRPPGAPRRRPPLGLRHFIFYIHGWATHSTTVQHAAHNPSRNACSTVRVRDTLYTVYHHELASTAGASPWLWRAPPRALYKAAGSILEPVGSEGLRSGVCGALPPLDRASSEPSEASSERAEPVE